MAETMGSLRRSNMCGELRAKDIGKEVVVMGWVQKERNLGSLIFADLRDITGIVQVVFDETLPEEIFKKAEKIRTEYVLAVKGMVREREAENKNIPTGQVEILAQDVKILDKAETPPIYIRD
ncbi:MAG TPA: OB-fold nucleic acid binding domain-containing protein, partial [Tissierellaceae bacterium]|nr:OB-fold nucleic acid binding domain-containing protein [Tissierellaceae bacterium]